MLQQLGEYRSHILFYDIQDYYQESPLNQSRTRLAVSDLAEHQTLNLLLIRKEDR